MDALSSIFTWLSEHEAGISAVTAILAIAVILFTGSLTSKPPTKILRSTARRARWIPMGLWRWNSEVSA
jgi:hypothetical protein